MKGVLSRLGSLSYYNYIVIRSSLFGYDISAYNKYFGESSFSVLLSNIVSDEMIESILNYKEKMFSYVVNTDEGFAIINLSEVLSVESSDNRLKITFNDNNSILLSVEDDYNVVYENMIVSSGIIRSLNDEYLRIRLDSHIENLSLDFGDFLFYIEDYSNDEYSCYITYNNMGVINKVTKSVLSDFMLDYKVEGVTYSLKASDRYAYCISSIQYGEKTIVYNNSKFDLVLTNKGYILKSSDIVVNLGVCGEVKGKVYNSTYRGILPIEYVNYSSIENKHIRIIDID